MVLKACVLSPMLEELQAAFSAINQLADCFLNNTDDAINFNQFHTKLKRMTVNATNFYNKVPSVKELEDELNSPHASHFVPCGIDAYNCLSMEMKPLLSPNPAIPENDFSPPPESTAVVQLLNYPTISSVAFSFVDERQQLLSLIERISKQSEIGIDLICSQDPLCLSAVCIELRECEYLIDLSEVPTAVSDLEEVFKNPNCTKVFHNTSQTCKMLHQFGISHIRNAFCITTAAWSLGLPANLEDLTAEVRHRLSEDWIPDIPFRAAQPNCECQRSQQQMAKTIEAVQETAQDDCRARPFSFAQMKIARQRMHYLLYLYDSLRLKLKENSETSLNDVFLISQQKVSMDWSKYNYYLTCPNRIICSTLYQQPLPNQNIYKSLIQLKLTYPNIMTDAVALSIALDLPTSEEALQKTISSATPQKQMIFSKKPSPIPRKLQLDISQIIKTAPPSSRGASRDAPKAKTIEDTIIELGWIPNNESSQSPKPARIDIRHETTVSPRLVKTASDNQNSRVKDLRSLRDPDQPTSVSLQIEGIPKTEEKIYQLANNVRRIQKLEKKAKTKLQSNQDDPSSDIPPEDILSNLVHIGYIDIDEVKLITNKLSEPKQPKPAQTRARSSDSKPSSRKFTFKPR